MHINRTIVAALTASLSLMACDSQPQTLNNSGPQDPQAEALSNAAPVELPPSIASSKTYRCKDNSLVYADFFTNDTVNVRLGSRDAARTLLTAAAPGQPFTAEGYSLSGNGASVTLTSPGKGSQSCKA